MALTATVLLPFGPELASVFLQLTQAQSSLQTAPAWKQSQYNLRHLVLLHLQVMAACSSAVKGRDVPASPLAVRADPTRPLRAMAMGRGRAFFLGRESIKDEFLAITFEVVDLPVLASSVLAYPPRFFSLLATLISTAFSKASSAAAIAAAAATSAVVGEDEDAGADADSKRRDVKELIKRINNAKVGVSKH